MVPDPSAIGAGHAVDHGLHFTNTGWNGSISNGERFTLRWNESLNSEVAELGLFRLIYPQDGLIMYELVSNLTGAFLMLPFLRASNEFRANDDVRFHIFTTIRLDSRGSQG